MKREVKIGIHLATADLYSSNSKQALHLCGMQSNREMVKSAGYEMCA